ncbi:NAD-binding protein [Saccharomonospora iraqiensis]|uniref:NAD-binding protein n=1 Tax=Saccharomonospora iraqiensis TaxID=52698 RepID=UPI001F387044|nr:NAD-binding protein [Saccharomonospora iraqiensis]
MGDTGHRVLAVDFDPHRVGANDRTQVSAVFGSAEDLHFLETLPLSTVRYVISTIPVAEINKALLHGLRHHGYEGVVALTAHTARDAALLREAGADVVLEPFAAAADATTEALDRLGPRSGGDDRGEDDRYGRGTAG